jgi:uncharacterized integral membrane protein
MEVDMDEKKGTGQNPAPERENSIQHHNSRLSDFCLGLNLISLVIFFIGYMKNNERVEFMMMGILFATALILMVLNKEDE